MLALEKHLRVLLAANMIKKVPSLSQCGQLTIRYNIQENANKLFTTIQDISQNF